MVIRTSIYKLHMPTLMRTSVRSTYRKLWWYTAASVATGAALLFLPAMWPAGVICIVTGLVAPYLKSAVTVSNAKRSPLSHREYVLEFDEEELRQFSDDELMAKLKYADLIKVRETPEGLQVWVTHNNWILAPRTAFSSSEEVAEARDMVTRGIGSRK